MNLSSRLLAAAAFARSGRFAADIGTDHAFLPIYLVSQGVSRGAVASDIHRGPIERARANISAAGLSDRITTVLTDGLSGLGPYAPEDIFILGMGGELIARILAASDLPRRPGVRLILQPMTHAADLRAALCASGFATVGETLVRDDLADPHGGERSRIYQVLCAEYDGVVRSLSPVELAVGQQNIARHDALTAAYAGYLCSVYRTRAEGLASAGKCASAELEMIRALEAVIHDCH